MFFDTNSALFFLFFFKQKLRGGGRFLVPHYKSSVPSALDWVLEHFSVTPVLNGDEKCGGQFPGPSPSVLGSEWPLTQGLVDVLLPNGQSLFSLCHLFQSSSVSFPFSWNPWQQGRLLSSELGWASGLCLPYVFSDLAGSSVSGPASRRCLAYPFRSFEPLSGFSCRPSVQDRSALAAPLPSSVPGLLCPLSSCLEAFQ